MKTTIDLPDEVLYRAKVIAAQRRTTLKDLVIAGLQLVTDLDAGKNTDRAGRLLAALDKARNTEPIGPLKREDIYDRSVLRGH
jgi:hypothetical protein